MELALEAAGLADLADFHVRSAEQQQAVIQSQVSQEFLGRHVEFLATDAREVTA